MAIVKVIEMRGEFDCRSETGRTRDGVLENLVQWQKEIFTRDEKANIVLFTLLTRECSGRILGGTVHFVDEILLR